MLSYPASMSQQCHQRLYNISRAEGVGSLDPTAGIMWTPRLDTDALFFALKMAFPEGESHGSRLRSALIEFLREEQEVERRQLTGSSPSTDQSLGNPRTDVIEDSRGLGFMDGRKRKSNSGIRDLRGEEFGLQRERKWRRTMTTEEKKEYRMRRARGACGGCKRKKRKCTHNEVGEEGGYEGDCEVGISPAEGAGTEDRERRDWSRMADEDSFPLATPAVGNESLGPPLSNFDLQKDIYTTTLEVSLESWSQPPWPSPLENTSYDLTSPSALAMDAILSSPMDFSLPFTNLEGAGLSQNWPQEQRLYRVQTEGIIPVPASSASWSSRDRGDYDDETYQSGEEAEGLGKMAY